MKIFSFIGLLLLSAGSAVVLIVGSPILLVAGCFWFWKRFFRGFWKGIKDYRARKNFMNSLN